MNDVFLELVLVFGAAMILGSILGLGVVSVIMRRTYGHWFPRYDCNCRAQLEEANMGIQRLSDKKVRKLSELAGMEFVKAAVYSDGKIAEAVTADDIHYDVDRRTGEVTPTPDLNEQGQGHWASCIGLE